MLKYILCHKYTQICPGALRQPGGQPEPPGQPAPEQGNPKCCPYPSLSGRVMAWLQVRHCQRRSWIKTGNWGCWVTCQRRGTSLAGREWAVGIKGWIALLWVRLQNFSTVHKERKTLAIFLFPKISKSHEALTTHGVEIRKLDGEAPSRLTPTAESTSIDRTQLFLGRYLSLAQHHLYSGCNYVNMKFFIKIIKLSSLSAGL